ncbi:MAG: MoaD/ThiS family protein [Thermoprotei archaeon]
MAKIKPVGFFRYILGKELIEIQLEKPKRLIDIIGELPDKERAIILVNGKNADFTTEISNDDEVIIIPIIGGG